MYGSQYCEFRTGSGSYVAFISKYLLTSGLETKQLYLSGRFSRSIPSSLLSQWIFTENLAK